MKATTTGDDDAHAPYGSQKAVSGMHARIRRSPPPSNSELSALFSNIIYYT